MFAHSIKATKQSLFLSSIIKLKSVIHITKSNTSSLCISNSNFSIRHSNRNSSYMCLSSRSNEYEDDSDPDSMRQRVDKMDERDRAALDERKKQEIYLLHKTNPKDNTIISLSQKYKTSLDRMKAVIFLMQGREEYLNEHKLDNIPPIWSEMHNRVIEAENPVTKKDTPSASAATADSTSPAAEDGKEGSTGIYETLAVEYSMAADEVKNIVLKLKEHHGRQENLQAWDDHMTGVKEMYEDSGVDTNFCETESRYKGTSIKDSYYPKLFGDEGFKEEKKFLIKRIEKETLAEKVLDVDAILEAYDHKTKIIKESSDGKLRRYKLAFRDISPTSAMKTNITTRSGVVRTATPLEEAQRSWVTKPTSLDFSVGKAQLAPFADPDSDEEAAKQLVLNKLAHRKKLNEKAKAK